MTHDQPLLDIKNLNVSLATPAGTLHAVKGIDLTLRAGETKGIVGESGSGKSVSTMAIARLLPKKIATITADRMHFDGQDLLHLDDSTFYKTLSGSKLSVIFQEPMTSLNPVYTLDRQMTETLTRHGTSHLSAAKRALELFERVKLPDAKSRLKQYPHQLSGGQRQRVMIAMALMHQPKLLIADEPTTALDVSVQKDILTLLSDLQKELNMAMIFITHDLSVVAQITDSIHVMYGGALMESGPTRHVLTHAKHPYTKGLLDCLPDINKRQQPLKSLSRQFLSQMTPDSSLNPADNLTTTVAAPTERKTIYNNVLLRVQALEKTFKLPRKGFKPAKTIKAVNNVSFDLYEGEVLALVGESGCGKSTTAKILSSLLKADGGSVQFQGNDVNKMDKFTLAKLSQPVFQDPYSSLNPRQTISQIIEKPLIVHNVGNAQIREKAVKDIMNLVGLSMRFYHAYPGQMSGGQRQRVAVARALMLKPKLLICDEPTSALDVSVQAKILNLLRELQDQLNTTMLLISHDMGVVSYLADRVAVMNAGQIVEIGHVESIIKKPQHPYTQMLITAAGPD